MRFSKNLPLFLLIFLWIPGCAEIGGGSATSQVGLACDRQPVTSFFAISEELTSAYNCDRGFLICAGALVEQEVKKIAVYSDIPQWLYETYDNTFTVLTVAEQDVIIADAINLANLNKPVSLTPGTFKGIEKIEFFWELIYVPDPPVPYFIGADITYAACTNKLPK